MLTGPDLHAVPATADRNESDAAAGIPTPVDVYLPAGRWIDLYTGAVLDGGRHIVRPPTLDDFPFYLRAGAAIGFNQRIDGVWPTPWNRGDLDRRDRTGWTYAPGKHLHTRTKLGPASRKSPNQMRGHGKLNRSPTSPTPTKPATAAATSWPRLPGRSMGTMIAIVGS